MKNRQRKFPRLAHTLLETHIAHVRGLIEEDKTKSGKSALPNHRPIILFGDYSGGKDLAVYLANFFTVIIMDECYTSQQCSRCHKKMKQVKHNDIRRYFCSDKKVKKITQLDCCQLSSSFLFNTSATRSHARLTARTRKYKHA